MTVDLLSSIVNILILFFYYSKLFKMVKFIEQNVSLVNFLLFFCNNGQKQDFL